MIRLVQQLPQSKKASARTELRTSFRQPIGSEESLEDRLRVAGEKIAFLRIVTPKKRPSGGQQQQQQRQSTRRYVYRNGKVVEGTGETLENGRVVSNWDGNNLDPCSVKRHKQQLRRAGFANNLHAKGIF